MNVEYSGHTVVERRAGGNGERSRCARFHGLVERRKVPCVKPILKLSAHEVLCVDNIYIYIYR